MSRSKAWVSYPGMGMTGPRLLPWLIVLALIVTPLWNKARAQADDYPLKAESLFNFSQFTDWPPEAFAGPTAPLVFGILGKDPFGNSLEDAVRGKRVNGRPLVIQHFRKVGDIKTCHIVFISASESKRLARILAALKGSSILTASDMADFAARGGMVRLLAAGDQVQFQINLDALKNAGLTVSSKLLRAAEIVSTTNK